PGSDVIGTDLGLLDQVCRVRNLAEVEPLVEVVVGVEPTDMRGREIEIALRVALGEFRLVETVDGTAGDELHGHPRLLCEFLRHSLGHEIAPAAAPDADDELVLRRGGKREQQQTEAERENRKTFHAATS